MSSALATENAAVNALQAPLRPSRISLVGGRAGSPNRFLLYSHDGLGLGHVGRNLVIAAALVERSICSSCARCARSAAGGKRCFDGYGTRTALDPRLLERCRTLSRLRLACIHDEPRLLGAAGTPPKTGRAVARRAAPKLAEPGR